MTNTMIILNESINLMKSGVIGSDGTGRKMSVTYEENGEEITEIIDIPEEIHTFADWKARGYFVNKGEKAIAKFPIWNYTSKPSKAARKAAEERGEEVSEDPHYYMKEACFFKKSQTSAATKYLPMVI